MGIYEIFSVASIRNANVNERNGNRCMPFTTPQRIVKHAAIHTYIYIPSEHVSIYDSLEHVGGFEEIV